MNSDANQRYDGSFQNDEFIDRNALNYQRRKRNERKRMDANELMQNENQEYT